MVVILQATVADSVFFQIQYPLKQLGTFDVNRIGLKLFFSKIVVFLDGEKLRNCLFDFGIWGFVGNILRYIPTERQKIEFFVISQTL